MSDPLVSRRTAAVGGLGTHAARAASALLIVVAGAVAMWGLEIADYALDNQLDAYGVRGHLVNELPQIFTAPFLHGGFEHLMANTVPFLILGFLAAARGISKFFAANLFIIVVGGLGIWFTSPSDRETLGASILIFGYFGYLLGRGIFERHLLDIVVAVVVVVLYGSTFLFGLLPTNPNISWQSHLFGLIGGLLAAWVLRRRSGSFLG